MEADDYARCALVIKENLDLSAEPWTTYHILARIAQAKGNAHEAVQWRRRAQESFFAYPGAAYQLPQWVPAFIQIMTAAVQGNTKANSEVEKILHRNEEGDGLNLVVAIRRMLSGERDFERLRTELDYGKAYIVHRILTAFSGEPAPSEHVTPSDDTTAHKKKPKAKRKA